MRVRVSEVRGYLLGVLLVREILLFSGGGGGGLYLRPRIFSSPQRFFFGNRAPWLVFGFQLECVLCAPSTTPKP